MSSSAPSRTTQVQNIKIIAYHHIQDTKQKLFNRLSYLLLQHIVSQYQSNQYFQIAVIRSMETAKQYIADAIELFMQQRIQLKNIRPSDCQEHRPPLKKEINVQEQKKEIIELQQQVQQLRLQNERTKKEMDKQNRRYSKLIEKNNILSQMILELKIKNKQHIQCLVQNHNQKIEHLHMQNCQLKEKNIRLEVTLQFMEKYSKNINKIQSTTLDKIDKVQGQFQPKSIIKQLKIFQNISLHLQFNKPRKLSIFSYNKSISIVPVPKAKHFISFDCIHQQFKDKKSTNLLQINKQQIEIKIQKKNSQNHVQFTQFLHIQKQQTNKNQNIFIQTQPQITQNIEQEQIQQLKQQVRILKYLNQQFQTQHLILKQKITNLSTQKSQLVDLSNNLLRQFESKEKQNSQKQDIFHQQIHQLCQLIESITNQKNQLLIIIQQFQNNTHHSNLEHSKIRSSHQHSDHTQESSNAPRKQHNFTDFELSPPQPFLSKNLNNPLPLEQYIRKDTITKYLLQFLDHKCRGQAKVALLNQIGECLNWTEPHFARVQLYSRRIKLKSSRLTATEESQSEDSGTFKDKFFRFLINESESQM